jgi:hypothetical protein
MDKIASTSFFSAKNRINLKKKISLKTKKIAIFVMKQDDSTTFRHPEQGKQTEGEGSVQLTSTLS